MENEGAKRGRPRRWSSTTERQREHRKRKAEVYQAMGELVLAVINAKIADPELQQQIDAAQDDLTVLKALTAYYRKRHWHIGVGEA
jgi:hypothetical protein